MQALHYIILGVLAATILYIRYAIKRRRRTREHEAYKRQIFESARMRATYGMPKSTRPVPPPPPPDRKRYTYKATEPPPPKKQSDDDYNRPYLWTDTNPGYIDDTPHRSDSHHDSHSTNHQTPDYGGGGDFGGGGSSDSWGSSDSGSSDSGSSYND
jgi:uncharacterized membrane protein YgcG